LRGCKPATDCKPVTRLHGGTPLGRDGRLLAQGFHVRDPTPIGLGPRRRSTTGTLRDLTPDAHLSGRLATPPAGFVAIPFPEQGRSRRASLNEAVRAHRPPLDPEHRPRLDRVRNAHNAPDQGVGDLQGDEQHQGGAAPAGPCKAREHGPLSRRRDRGCAQHRRADRALIRPARRRRAQRRAIIKRRLRVEKRHQADLALVLALQRIWRDGSSRVSPGAYRKKLCRHGERACWWS